MPHGATGRAFLRALAAAITATRFTLGCLHGHWPAGRMAGGDRGGHPASARAGPAGNAAARRGFTPDVSVLDRGDDAEVDLPRTW